MARLVLFGRRLRVETLVQLVELDHARACRGVA
jgi:hypothetical protein